MAHLRESPAFSISSPLVLHRVRPCLSSVRPKFSARQRRVAGTNRSELFMSGVNGGIDYEIDLDSLPEALSERVKAIQRGPESPLELIAAAKDIAAAAPTNPQTLPVLVDMLGYNNPVAARIAVEALVKGGKSSIEPLLTGVGAFNYAVNAYALRALAGVGDPSVAAVCVACAKKGPIPGVRRAACAAIASLRFADVDSATNAYEVLLRIADGEPDWGVRYAAVVGLERFKASELLSDEVRANGVRVLEGILSGERVFSVDNEEEDGEEGELKSDPTVIARATVALENCRTEIETGLVS